MRYGRLPSCAAKEGPAPLRGAGVVVNSKEKYVGYYNHPARYARVPSFAGVLPNCALCIKADPFTQNVRGHRPRLQICNGLTVGAVYDRAHSMV